MLEEGKEVGEWCRSYFQRLYNEGHEEEVEAQEEAVQEVEETEESQEPTEREVKESIRRLRNGKAAGASGIVGEMLKAGKDQVIKQITQFLKRVWREETIPEDWKGGDGDSLVQEG